ncbi:MAG: FAD-binding protein [Clostridiales bacterium]|nr:FAD-binding protein [Clostridiales bacterium]
MLRIHQLKLPLSMKPEEKNLRRLCAAYLKVQENRIGAVEIKKRSVDARDKGDVHFALTVDAEILGGGEAKLAAKFKPNQAAVVERKPQSPDVFSMKTEPWGDRMRPIVVGAGPAGLFCALALARRGAKPLLIERGKPVEQRAEDIAAFEENALLDEESNVLFGEGGAGTFSDGKLTCGLSSPHIQTVLSTLYACGAPESILTQQKPHIGTDVLRGVLYSARRRLMALGGEVRFQCKMTDILLREGRVQAIRIRDEKGEDELPVNQLFLCIGHSARDTYRMLNNLGLPMEQKPFAIGARIEHLQKNTDRAQYGGAAGHPALPPAEYKLNVPTADKRGVYTFCMCPGGQVISAVHEKGTINVNGMSRHARDGRNSNAALLVGVHPGDFGSEHPLAGVDFQKKIEEAAFRAAGGYCAPCQRVEDLLKGRETKAFGEVEPTYRPGVTPGDLACCLPGFVLDNYRYALPKLGQRLKGFDHPDALLTGPETRSSAPLRMLRDKGRQSPLGGIYPLGEGAGHAGGIVSAAVDGLCAGLEA